MNSCCSRPRRTRPRWTCWPKRSCSRHRGGSTESPGMHPELRRARTLYYEWRCLPDRERGRIAPFAREVKELALDLRGHENAHDAELELAQANDALSTILRHSGLRAA